MSQAIQATCPGCRKTLRIPAEWVGRTLRCKNCGATMEARPRDRTPAPPPVAQPLAAPPAAPAEDSHPFAFDLSRPAPAANNSSANHSAELGITLPHYYRRRRASPWRNAILALVFLGIAGISIATLMRAGGNRAGKKVTGIPDANKTPAAQPIAKGDEPYPRRMLVIGISNYWYANPIAFGTAERALDRVAQRLGEAWHVPKEQLGILADGGATPIAPTGNAIKKTITQFLDTSRPQDHIVLMFVGHAVAFGTDGYLVPIDGELKAKDTLIPLAWLYAGLTRCKARQKLLIADLCRYDPGRGVERPGSKPLDPALAAQLQHPPEGVQVWSACSTGQYSYEGQIYLGDGTPRHVGFFCNELYEAVGPAQQKHIRLEPGKPEDPLPLESYVQGAHKVPGVFAATTAEVKDWLDVAQTPFAAGHAAAGGAPADTETPLQAFVVQKPTPPAGKAVADARLVEDILHETGEDIHRAGSPDWNVATMPFFDADLATSYRKDGKTTPLRDAVQDAVRLLKTHATNFDEEFRGNADAAVKKAVRMKQRLPARAMLKIEAMLAKLESARSEKPREKSKRWKANADFVTAKLQARWVYIYEYDLMLAKILKDQLPHSKKGKSSGLRLAAQEKLDVQSGQEWKKRAEEARKSFLKIARTYKGTPWEFLARREAVTALGLSWQPMP